MKTLQELTLLDKFLFDETMEDPETYEALLRIILGEEELKLLTPSQTEKEFRTAPWLKSIRVDVFSMDSDTIYSTEMQQANRDDLIKRTRYYQALIDSSLLAPGEINYNKIKNTTIIMIMPFDLFGKNRYVYTFEGVCKEDDSIKLNDGAKRIFINTHGQNEEDVTPEFIALMRFIEYNEGIETQEESAPNLAKIKSHVAEIKASEEVGVKFMQRWEEEALIRHEGIEEGRKEGLQEGRKEGIIEGMKKGQEDERLSSIKNIMVNLKLTADEAMDALKIPAGERKKYMTML